MRELPHYYSSLRPFREYFEQGTPILTYHHVGPRPHGVRLKGLYVSSALFSKQIAELRDEGFATKPYGQPGLHHASPATEEARTRLSALQSGSRASGKTVFLTFDDGFVDVLQHAMAAMRQHGFTGIQFLVADLLGKTSEWQTPSGEIPGQLMDKSQVREWLSAGNQIGSHTLTHPRLSQMPSERANEEITASKKKLEDAFGVPVHHFCYPYGDWNDEVKELVRAAGYKTACTTRFGVNASGTDPFMLNRITARYQSRNWKNFWGMLAGA